MSKKMKWITLTILAIVGLFLLGACSTDEEEQPMEFIYYDAGEETEYIDEETEFVAGEANQGTAKPFAFVYNEAGDYISLGMTKDDVEQIIVFAHVRYRDELIEDIRADDFDENMFKIEYLVNTYEGLIISFCDNEMVIEIILYDNDPALWFVRNGIAVGSHFYDEEFEEVWHLSRDYAYPESPWDAWDYWELYTFFFDSDHNPVMYGAENKHYAVMLQLYQPYGMPDKWEIVRIEIYNVWFVYTE